jgi:hypothetical protein
MMGLLSYLAVVVAAAVKSTPPTQSVVQCGDNVRAGVIVYGGTAGGVVAAVAAARMLKNSSLGEAYAELSLGKWDVPVLLVNPAAHLGGMVSSGLGHTDGRDSGGIAAEFFKAAGGYNFAPSTALRVFVELIANATVAVASSCAIASAQTQMRNEIGKAVLPRHPRPLPSAGASAGAGAGAEAVVNSITTVGGGTFAAPVFIDASYEGDLMARAGVSFTIGRESNHTYNEAAGGRLPVPPIWGCRCNWDYGAVDGRADDGSPLPMVSAGRCPIHLLAPHRIPPRVRLWAVSQPCWARCGGQQPFLCPTRGDPTTSQIRRLAILCEWRLIDFVGGGFDVRTRRTAGTAGSGRLQSAGVQLQAVSHPKHEQLCAATTAGSVRPNPVGASPKGVCCPPQRLRLHPLLLAYKRG